MASSHVTLRDAVASLAESTILILARPESPELGVVASIPPDAFIVLSYVGFAGRLAQGSGRDRMASGEEAWTFERRGSSSRVFGGLLDRRSASAGRAPLCRQAPDAGSQTSLIFTGADCGAVEEAASMVIEHRWERWALIGLAIVIVELVLYGVS